MNGPGASGKCVAGREFKHANIARQEPEHCLEGVEEEVNVQRFREQIAEGVVYLACTGLKEHDALANRIEAPHAFWASSEASACSEAWLVIGGSLLFICGSK